MSKYLELARHWKAIGGARYEEGKDVSIMKALYIAAAVEEMQEELGTSKCAFFDRPRNYMKWIEQRAAELRAQDEHKP